MSEPATDDLAAAPWTAHIGAWLVDLLLLGALITDPPGSSAYYMGGWVTYTNAMKVNELGVPESMLAERS